jgi:hypothetical protein
MSERPSRIDVSFGVDVDTEALDNALQTLENLRPGSVEYSAAWDELKELYTHFMGRLEGECAAYMNIAKEQARQLFSM